MKLSDLVQNEFARMARCDIVEINQERMENGLPPLEGWDEWAKHQKAMPEEHSKEVDASLGIVRDENGKAIRNE